jgi:hypothetical protein
LRSAWGYEPDGTILSTVEIERTEYKVKVDVNLLLAVLSFM